MNQIKIGKFIANERKAKKMTQLEFAEKLGVSNKSVSRWETGRNMPDMSVINIICQELDITITEFFSGERIAPQEMVSKAEERIITTIDNSNKEINKKRKELLVTIIVLILSVILSISSSINHIASMSERDTFVPNYSITEDYQTLYYCCGTEFEKEYIKIEIENPGISGDGQYGLGSYIGIVKPITDSKIVEISSSDTMYLVYEDEKESIIRLDTDYEEDYFYRYSK